jgi:hypothetical protein
MTPLDIGAEILSELRSINQRLDALEQNTPPRGRTWLTPNELGKLCGVTPRTLQTYVTTGRLRPESYKREARGKTFNYRYHRELALRDLGITCS